MKCNCEMPLWAHREQELDHSFTGFSTHKFVLHIALLPDVLLWNSPCLIAQGCSLYKKSLPVSQPYCGKKRGILGKLFHTKK